MEKIKLDDDENNTYYILVRIILLFIYGKLKLEFSYINFLNGKVFFFFP